MAETELLKHVAIYRVEEEDDIHLTAFGESIAEWSASSPEGIALLKLDAELRRPASVTPAVPVEGLEPTGAGKLIDRLWAVVNWRLAPMAEYTKLLAEMEAVIDEFAALKPPPADGGAEAKLVAFFNEPEAYKRWGHAGDYDMLSPTDTAIRALRAALSAPPIPDEPAATPSETTR